METYAGITLKHAARRKVLKLQNYYFKKYLQCLFDAVE